MLLTTNTAYEYTDLAVVDFAPVAEQLTLDAHRVHTPLGKAAGIEGDDVIGLTQLIDHLFDQYRDQRAVVPYGESPPVFVSGKKVTHSCWVTACRSTQAST